MSLEQCIVGWCSVERLSQEKTMQTNVRQKVTGQPGGLIALQSPDFVEGTEVEVIVLLEPPVQASLASLIGTGKGSFATAQEADQFIRQERDSWES
jgi:hypothetical protein